MREVLLADAESDLAVLRLLDAPALPALEFADSDTVEVGDLVLAIGNPFGVGQTVSSGIVSGLARSGNVQGRAGYFIQTDAPINPGNSGGALVDMTGAAGGHQHRDRHPVGRVERHRLCDPGQSGPAICRPGRGGTAER